MTAGLLTPDGDAGGSAVTFGSILPLLSPWRAWSAAECLRFQPRGAADRAVRPAARQPSYSCGYSVRFPRTSLFSGCGHPAPYAERTHLL